MLLVNGRICTAVWWRAVQRGFIGIRANILRRFVYSSILLAYTLKIWIGRLKSYHKITQNVDLPFPINARRKEVKVLRKGEL